MSSGPGVVIIGAGQAGARCASLLRGNGYAGSITLVGDEPHLPYERPPLSKEAMMAESRDIAAHVPPMFSAAYFEEHDIEIKTAAAAELIDIIAKTVRLRDGALLPYATLVVATGSRPRPYNRTNTDRQELLTLRDKADAHRLHARLRPGSHILLIGGGFIGLEIAAAAVTRGCDVTVIESQDRILKRALSAAAAASLSALHTTRGVTIKTACHVTALATKETGTDYVLNDGTKGRADVAVLGIGGLPNVEFAAAAGLALCDETGGILVDSACRTSAPDVYAIGDVASEFNPHYGRHTRLESWDNAEAQALRAATNILNTSGLPQASVSTSPVPWFWTDQYDLNLQIVGLTHGTDRHVERLGAGGKRVLFHFRGPHLLSAELFNSGRERRVVRQLIGLNTAIDEHALADSSVPLSRVLAQAQEATAGVAHGTTHGGQTL